MVGVAQLVRAPDCGSGGRGFKSHHSPHLLMSSILNILARVAELVDALDLESSGLGREGSSPSSRITLSSRSTSKKSELIEV